MPRSGLWSKRIAKDSKSVYFSSFLLLVMLDLTVLNAICTKLNTSL